jgi:hypothetical protein
MKLYNCKILIKPKKYLTDLQVEASLNIKFILHRAILRHSKIKGIQLYLFRNKRGLKAKFEKIEVRKTLILLDS